MNAHKTLSRLAVVSILLFLCRTGTAETVYDSLANNFGGEGAVFSGTHFFASSLELDGALRRVNSLVFNVHARDNPVTASVFASIHLDDGSGEEPGELLWESTPVEVLLTTDPLQRVALDVPLARVPDEIWVVAGITHNGIDSPLRFRDGDREVFTGTHRSSLVRGINSSDWRESPSWAMRVTAVPEPSTLGMLIVVLGAMLLRYGRRGR